MRTQFSKNVLAASVAAVFAFGAASVATPVFANEFAAITVSTASTSSTVPAKALQKTNNALTYVITASSTADTTSAGTVVISPSNGGKFTASYGTQLAKLGGSVSGTRTIALGAGNAAKVVGNTTIKVGGVTFTIAITSTANGSTAEVTSSSGSTKATSAAFTGTNDNYVIATALFTAINNAFPASTAVAADNAAGTITIDPNAILPLNTPSAVSANATIGAAAGVGAGSFTVTDAANAAKAFVDSNGAINLIVAANTPAASDAITLTGFTLDMSGVTVGNTVSATITSAPSGWPSGAGSTQVNLLTAGASKVTASTGGAVGVYAPGQKATIPSFTVAETFAGDFAVTTTSVAPIKLKLDNGLVFDSGLTYTAAGFAATSFGGSVVTFTATTASTSAGVFTVLRRDGTVLSVTVPVFTNAAGAGSAALKTALVNAGFSASDITDNGTTTVTLANGAGAFIANPTPGGTNPGAISGNYPYAQATDGSIYIPVSTVSPTVGTITVAGTLQSTIPTGTAAADQNLTATAVVGSAAQTSSFKALTVGSFASSFGFSTTPTTTPTLFSGRTSTPATLKYSEGVAGLVPVSTVVTLTLNKGKFASAPTSATTSGGTTFSTFTLNADSTVATATVTAASTASTAGGGYNTITLGNLDLTSVTGSGSVTLTIAGNGVTTQAVTLGNHAEATATTAPATSATSGLVVAAASSTFSIPDIQIVESAAGALLASGGFSVYVPQANGAALTATGATAKAYKADGTDVSATIFGSSTGATPTVTTNGVAYFTVQNASTSTTGPVTVKITGLKGTLLSSASGSITAVVGGASSSTDQTLSSSSGAGVTKTTLTIGSVASDKVPTYPTVTVADSTKAVLKDLQFIPAYADQSKPGAIYVAAIFNGSVFFITPPAAGATTATLTPYVAGKSPLPYATSLAPVSVNIITSALDISSFKGLQLIMGYGIGIAPLADPFTNMLTNSTYNVVYTVK